MVTIYEGITQVRVLKIMIYVRQYELLKMLTNENVKEKDIGFIDIVDNAKSLRKFYSNGKLVRSLLGNQWGSIVTFQEAQKLKILKMEDMIRKLLVYEIDFNKEKKEILDKGAGMKISIKDTKSQDNLKSAESEDEIVMLARGFHKMLKKKICDLKKLHKE